MNKSPLGVMPRFLHDELRIKDLKDAIERYVEAGMNYPPEWDEEIKELYARYR